MCFKFYIYNFRVLEFTLSIASRVLIRVWKGLFMLINWLLCVQWPNLLQIPVVSFKERLERIGGRIGECKKKWGQS